jgi:hypothetical protein
MKKRGVIFEVQTLLLSILIVKYGFLIVQEILHVFIVNQYNPVVRVG